MPHSIQEEDNMDELQKKVMEHHQELVANHQDIKKRLGTVSQDTLAISIAWPVLVNAVFDIRDGKITYGFCFGYDDDGKAFEIFSI